VTHAAWPWVLCYHRVGGPLELGVTRVRRSVFQRQMTALAKAGWTTLTLDEFTRRVQPGGSSVPPQRSFLLSFDDGYASLAEHAYPILADVGFTAVTFLVTDFVGRDNRWDVRYTWRRLRHLDWEAITRWVGHGFEFASHSASHARLTWLADGERAAELERSRETLIRRLGTGAGRALAYPFGARDAGVEAAARAAGYELGFGGVRGNGSLLNLSRVPVYAWDLGDVPLGLRQDSLGALGRHVAHAANRCAVGTSVMLQLKGKNGRGEKGEGLDVNERRHGFAP
jgi:peptidoglycan/xylan/chitin deacetylase (PgdA/CDA1 family)